MKTKMEDRVRQRAYELWEAEGKPHGHHQAHWLKAEAEAQTAEKITAKSTPKPTAAKKTASVKAKAAPRKTRKP